MPELRSDPVSGHVVIVAPEREARPHTARARATDESGRAECPFCAGHESMTPPEITRTGDGPPDGSGWRVRVVPNLYPIVGGERAAAGATGAHEVVVLSPNHERSFGQLPDGAAVEVIGLLRDRAHAHLEAGRAYVQVLVNHGREAGASLAHPHAQLVALDLVPPAVEAARRRFDAARTDVVAGELAATRGGRFSVADGPAPAWCPPASGVPFQIRVAHRSTRARFDEATDAEIGAVAITLRDSLARLATTAGDVAYNVVLHTSPPVATTGFFHWYLDVLPRLSVVAGFELGTGLLVNTIAPEQAAARLREVELTGPR